MFGEKISDRGVDMKNRSAIFMGYAACIAYAFSSAWAEPVFVDHAQPIKTIYFAIQKENPQTTYTIPFKEYKLIEETPNGYEILLDKASFYPPVGYMKKKSRTGNDTAIRKYDSIEIRSKITEPIYVGDLAFVEGGQYPVLDTQGTNLLLRYASPYFTATGIVSRSDCRIVSAKTLEEAYEKASKAAIEQALKLTEYGEDYNTGLKALKGALSKYPHSSLAPAAKKRLAEINNNDYRQTYNALMRTMGLSDADALRNLDYILSNHPDTSLTPLVKRKRQTLQEKVNARLAYEKSQLAKGLVLHNQSWVTPEQKEGLITSERQSSAVAIAMRSANNDKYYNSAIETLEAAINNNPFANNLQEAQMLLSKYQREQEEQRRQQAFEKAQKAKGLVWYNNQWTPRRSLTVYDTASAAAAAAERLNFNQQCQLESMREMSINMAMMGGESVVTGPPVYFYTYRYDDDLDGFILIHK